LDQIVTRATSHFRNIAFFEEDKAAGNRQQRQLVGGDKVFPHAQTDNQRATGTGRQQWTDRGNP
jgi:hypothetical protein